MISLHIQNRVHNFEEWQSAFDRFENFRADNGVVAYRISRRADSPLDVSIDLDFVSRQSAESFLPMLLKIWQTPQSFAQLVSHEQPYLVDVVRQTGRLADTGSPGVVGQRPNDTRTPRN